jgi:light-regulated signal transduction histidine kinase (bacteriophytochrome)
MTALIQALLSYARVSTQDAPFQAVSLSDVLSNVMENMHLSIEESGASITSDPLPEIVANPMQIFQLMQNLVSNAIKYRSAERPLRIHIGVAGAPGEFIFSVADNGQGFNPLYGDRIFGVFHRLHGRDVPGTGIGLSICKKIVERHEGRIWVESQPGQGSTFFFSIPAHLSSALAASSVQ